MHKDWDIERVKEEYIENRKHYSLIDSAANKIEVTEHERWHIPEKVTYLPEVK